MATAKPKNTKLELELRRLLLNMGYRGYRVHYDKLPGKPDVVFTKRRKVIFAHGCFWHRHCCKKGRSTPKTNKSFWEPKLQRNAERDKENLRKIEEEGWDVLLVWECQLKNPELLRKNLLNFLRS